MTTARTATVSSAEQTTRRLIDVFTTVDIGSTGSFIDAGYHLHLRGTGH